MTPDWVTETPPEQSYSLVAFNPDGDADQEIECTRAEFIALKRHLALMRGQDVPEGPAG